MSSHPLQTRRRFLGQAVAGAVAAGTMVTTPALAVLRPRVRRIAVMSDLHIGIKSRGIDGAQWLTRAIDDLNRNLGSIDYGLTLGDITHDGDRRSLIEYLELRDKSRVPRWFELAGNHDHHRDGIANYGDLVRAPASYTFIDGNVAWIFVSAENNACPGDMSRASLRWLREQLAEHQDKVIILCSHQLPPHTVRRSNEYIFSMQPRNEIAGILESHPIALHLCGHEHHSPYSSGCIATRAVID